MSFAHFLACIMLLSHLCLPRQCRFIMEEAVSIRAARLRRGLTQRELAEATGIDQASISRMENGKQAITLEHLRQIARALATPVEALVAETEAA